MADRLVFLATAWGSQYGGVNSLNADLCAALGRSVLPQYQVICVVLKADGNQIRHAEESSVVLISLSRTEGSEFSSSLAYWTWEKVRDLGPGEVLWWFGHDIISGEAALEAQRISGQGKLGIFHHTNYFAFDAVKHRDGSLAMQRRQLQARIFSAADTILAIGPKLAQNARSLISDSNSERVIELIPGLASVQPQPIPPTFQALTFGRVTPADELVKQSRLTIAGLGKAICDYPELFGHDPRMIVIGAPAEHAKTLQESLLKLGAAYAKRVLNVIVLPFMENRTELLSTIATSSVCLMPSFHEGFGLAGLEAIAAEVPLVLSPNSGLFEFIDKRFGGLGTGCLNIVDIEGALAEESFSDGDVEKVASCLRSIQLRIDAAKANAGRLKELLRSSCTWQGMALTLAGACGLRPTYELTPGTEAYAKQFEAEHVEEWVPSRERHFDQVWTQMEEPEQKYLIFFGGIASSLCNEEAARRYAQWLIRNDVGHLFLCYESGEAAQLRAAALDGSILDPIGGLPLDPPKRMLEKEKRVVALGKRLEELVAPPILGRVHLISLSRPLTSYIIISDRSIFWAPVLQSRSTKTMSFRMSRRAPPVLDQLFGYILFQLSFLDQVHDVTVLRKLLEAEVREVASEKNGHP